MHSWRPLRHYLGPGRLQPDQAGENRSQRVIPGVSEGALSNFVNRHRSLTLTTAAKLAKALGLELRPTGKKGQVDHGENLQGDVHEDASGPVGSAAPDHRDPREGRSPGVSCPKICPKTGKTHKSRGR